MEKNTENLVSDVRNAVIKAIAAKGTTRAECAKACGLSSTFFTEWENGKVKTPGFDKVFKIFRYLGLSLDTLGQEDVPTAQPQALTADEAEILRLYQMQDMEGRTEILHAAYEQKRRLASESACANSSFDMAEHVKSIIDINRDNENGAAGK